MCTRFFIEEKSEELEAIVHEVERSLLTQRFNSAGERVYTAGEIRPTNVTPVLAPDKSGKQKAFPMRWGFQIPGRSSDRQCQIGDCIGKTHLPRGVEKPSMHRTGFLVL